MTTLWLNLILMRNIDDDIKSLKPYQLRNSFSAYFSKFGVKNCLLPSVLPLFYLFLFFEGEVEVLK